MHVFRKLLLGVIIFVLSWFGIKSSVTFDQASLSISTNATNTPFDFTISFRTIRNIYHHEFIAIVLPRFTKQISVNTTNNNITFGNLLIAPSYYFHAAWIEGMPHYDDPYSPYMVSELHLQTKGNLTIEAMSVIELTVFKENGIGAICGFPSNDVLNASGHLIHPFRPFKIATINPRVYLYNLTETQLNYTYNNAGDVEFIVPYLANITYARNTSYLNNDSYVLDAFSGVGQGCSALSGCLGRGACDYCYERCECFEGYGASADLLTNGRDVNPDCSSRACPAGRAIGDVPTGSNTAHAMAECSNMGKCDRSTGQCRCFEPFTGSACEKLSCPNDCSGHGRCTSMADMAREARLLDPLSYPVEYGSGAGLDSVAWDHQTMYGCVCDSAWEVGFKKGQRQLAQYFGPDCSQKRCASGNDPFTSVDEEDCFGVNQAGSGPQLGEEGNKCHVDCSNRGVCNYGSGMCDCFDSSWGEACQNIANAGRHHLYSEEVGVDNYNRTVPIQGN